MNEETLIRIMKAKILNGIDKNHLKEDFLFKKIPEYEFNDMFLKAKKPISALRNKQKRNRAKIYEKTISVRLPNALYEKLWHIYHQQVGIPVCYKNKSYFLREFITEAVQNKYKEMGMDWEDD